MDKSKILLPVLAVLLGSAACQPSPPATADVTPVPTLTREPTRTATAFSMATRSLPIIPTKPSEATRNPENLPVFLSDLHSTGPYIFLDNIAYESDGSGMREFGLPEGFQSNFSPDRRWYAYMAEVNATEAEKGSAPPDKRHLHIYNLFTGEIRDIAPLAPPDYYDRQEKMTDAFIQECLSHGCNTDEYGIDVHGAISNLGFWQAWSPDSRYLAFAAIIDGNSSDVYAYDVDTGIISRKDADTLNVGYIGWSPDGKWIRYVNWIPSVYFAFMRINEWTPTPARFVRADSTNKKLSLSYCLQEWIGSDEAVFSQCRYTSGGNGGGTELLYFNLATGANWGIWKNQWYAFAVDPIERTILLSAEDPCNIEDCTQSSSGVYMGSLTGPLTRVADGFSDVIIFRDGNIHPFLLFSNNDVQGISSDGGFDSLAIGLSFNKINLSPDHRWAVLYGEAGLVLLDEMDQKAYQTGKTLVHDIEWQTNGRGLFMMVEDQILYLPMDTLEIVPIIHCPAHACGAYRSIFFPSGIFLPSLPNLRAQAPAFEDRTRGTTLWSKATFKDLLEPGTNEYSVTLPAYSEWRWNFSWCAAKEAGLAGILEPFEIAFSIGGEPIGEDIFRIYDSAKGRSYCRTWATLLSGWQPGDATDLEIRYTLAEAINDGAREYPAGEYRQVMHVTVKG